MLQFEMKAELWLPGDNPRSVPSPSNSFSQDLQPGNGNFCCLHLPALPTTSSAAGSFMGHWGDIPEWVKFQTVPGQLWLLVTAEVPKHNPQLSPAPAQTLLMCFGGTQETEIIIIINLKDSGHLKEVDTEGTRLFSPNKSLFSSKSAPNYPSDGNKKGKKCASSISQATSFK